MTRLFSVASTTLTGTTGNDILNAPGTLTAEVAGFQGNDTITLAKSDDLAYGGAGNDSITLSSSTTIANTVVGGSGNDSVFVATSVSTLDGSIGLNDGDDRFVNTGVQIIGGAVGGNSGLDTISLAGGIVNATVGGGSQADSLAFTAGTLSVAAVIGGGGKDTITLNGTQAFTTTTIQSGEGHDRINVSGASTWTNSIIAAGKGLDSIAVNSNVAATVAGGGQDDTIAFADNGVGSNSVIFGDGMSTSQTAGGADVIGNSSLIVTGNLSIYGSGGNDTIDFGNPNAAAKFFIDGGAEDDLIASTGTTLAAVATSSTIGGGDGADTIKFNQVSTGNILLGGAGADSIFVQTAFTTINGGSGADQITIGNTSVVTGVQDGVYTAVTVNGGSGADTINFTITNLGGASFATAGATAASAGLGTVVYESGDTVVIGNTSLSVSGAEWAGAGGQIEVASAISGLATQAAGILCAAGSISVFDAGDDLVIGIRMTTVGGTDSGFAFLTIENGGSLIKTTSTGQVNAGTSNFGFTVAANAGTAGSASSTGVKITFS